MIWNAEAGARVILVCAIVATGACGNGGGGEEDSTADTAAEPDAAGDTPSDVPSEDTGPEAISPEDRNLWIGLMRGQHSAGSTCSAVVATFSTLIDGRRCQGHIHDNCEVLDCRADSVTVGPTDIEGVSMGTVTISGGTGEDVVIEPTDVGAYPVTILAAERWQEGDSLTVSAAGDVVPVVSETIDFPPPPVFTTPDFASPPSGGFTIDLTTPFTATWPAVDGTMAIDIYQEAAGMIDGFDFVEIICEFTGTDGTGTIPTEVLSYLDPSDTPTGNSSISGIRMNRLDTTAGDHSLKIRATSMLSARATVE